MTAPLKLAGGDIAQFGAEDTVPATLGGTGQASFVVGDMFYADTTTTIAKLSPGTAYNTLQSNGPGAAPSFAPLYLTGTSGTTGTLPASRGGTGVATLTGLAKGNGIAAFTAAVPGTDYIDPAGLAAVATGANTGDETTATIKDKLGITTLSGSNTGDQDLSSKQDVLVSGTNIRTVNGQTLLGSTDIVTGDVTLTSTQTLANKTLTAPVVTNYTETIYAPAAGASFTVDLANGTVQKLTTNANATITLPTSTAGKSYLIMVAYGGAHSVTWAGGSTIKWAGGTAPTATSVSGKFDIFAFTCDGANTYGRTGGSRF